MRNGKRMNKRIIWKILFLVAALSLALGMTVLAEEEDLTLVSVSDVEDSGDLVMAGGHGRVFIDPAMSLLSMSNNSKINLSFVVNSYADPTDYYEIVIYRGTVLSPSDAVYRKVSSFSENVESKKYVYEWNTTNVGKYPPGIYTIVVTSYYLSDQGNAVNDTDSLEINLEDYRLVLDRAFVERLYNKVFMRSADPDGLTYWSERLYKGLVSGGEVIAHFVTSPEFVNKHTSNREYVQTLYRAVQDREGVEQELAYWLEFLEGGVSRNYVLKGFVDSPEYGRQCASYGITQGTITLTEVRDRNPQIAGFVNRLYRLIQNREDDGSGINYWVNILVKKQQTPQTVAHGFVFSPEFINKNYGDEDFTRIMYRAMLNREGEDAGVQYYMNQMANGLTRERMFWGFANSPEFKGIIASYGL